MIEDKYIDGGHAKLTTCECCGKMGVLCKEVYPWGWECCDCGAVRDKAAKEKLTAKMREDDDAGYMYRKERGL